MRVSQPRNLFLEEINHVLIEPKQCACDLLHETGWCDAGVSQYRNPDRDFDGAQRPTAKGQ